MYKNLGGILKIIKVKIANKTIDARKFQHFQQNEQLPFKIKIFKYFILFYFGLCQIIKNI